MKLKKSISRIVIVGVLSTLLVGCGSDKSETASSTDNSPEKLRKSV